MDDLSSILIVAGIINLIIIIALYSKLSSINKEAQKTNYILTKMLDHQGAKLTATDYQVLRK